MRAVSPVDGERSIFRETDGKRGPAITLLPPLSTYRCRIREFTQLLYYRPVYATVPNGTGKTAL